MKNIFLLLIAFIGTHTIVAQTNWPYSNTTNIYIVRHAEKLEGNDPLLTDEGNTRAGDLMRILNDKKIKRIYVTQYLRTQNTADSLRIQLGIDTIQILADTSCASLFTAITKNNDWDKPILIISHSNIMQKIIYKLGVTDFPQEYIPANEFDNLYQIRFEKMIPVLTQLKYGKASAAAPKMLQ